MSLGSKIASMRLEKKLTQEELAEMLGVSRQAVQKWESDITKPDIDNIMLLSEFFDISLDTLLGKKRADTSTEELRFNRHYLPNYSSMHKRELLSNNIKIEFRQLYDEGKDISQYKMLTGEIAALPVSKSKEDMCDNLCDILCATKSRADYDYYEPSTLDKIKEELRDSGISLNAANKDILEDKVRGAWLGRICGCLLGKPIEGIMSGELERLLKLTNNYPLRRYILFGEITDEMAASFDFPLKHRTYADMISAAPSDDDTNYTCMYALKLVERYGRDFTPSNVAQCWLDNQPKDAYCTAERVAFINFVNGYAPPVSAVHRNPFREWIGTQIRADYFGYINPGNPVLAAEMAWRDASISHVKNGIYGEMFVAAMLAAAAVCDSIADVIKCGLAQIPSGSRLYKEINDIIKMHAQDMSSAQCIELVHSRYDERDSHGWCHTIPNAMIVATALLYGELDYSKSICLAVQASFDTDCNGATVGSIVGMMIGAKNIPEVWTKPINGKLETSIFGVGTVSVSELVDVTMKHMPK
ncbi:MAG: ADP-ribosylglycohydrolase family protein [Eubacteriales bacterium]